MNIASLRQMVISITSGALRLAGLTVAAGLRIVTALLISEPIWGQYSLASVHSTTVGFEDGQWSDAGHTMRVHYRKSVAADAVAGLCILPGLSIPWGTALDSARMQSRCAWPLTKEAFLGRFASSNCRMHICNRL